MVVFTMEASEKEIIGATRATGEKDGSVVSGVTDPTSMMEAEIHDTGVPKQVVVEDSSSLEGTTSQGETSPENKTATKATEPAVEGQIVPSERRVDKALNEELSDYDNVKDFIVSEEGQNAIVERSPGGRYVRFMEKLGSGASKDVYRAYDTQEGIEVAWNVVSLGSVPTKAERNRIINEVRLLERLHHENIISFHGSWVNREKQEVIFVTEILSSGTLKSFINKVQVIRWKIAKRWAVQILRGLAYLHSQEPKVIHRDLKCENIFINGTSGDLRIGDLGLSTVHQNGKQLSVLGTPEFMAPDMYYQEKSYDEKVDVYAFGMCLLEIFTKEIPYSECSNPAQIYNKVMAGEPPEVLSRLQSKHAREFVELCLGKKDEEGNFVRPTVAELLQHEFLVKRANDDDEVVVLPPLRKMAILETQSLTIPPRKKADVPQKHPESSPTTTKTTPNEDDDNDQFEEMQESEITMRKVKVMMGRGQELEEDEVVVKEGEGETVMTSERTVDSVASVPNVIAAVTPADQPVAASAETVVTAPARVQSGNYPLKASVIENQNARPYDDDTLKLILALPVHGQTQNVEFDFDLVADDPVQVAKEMVQELSIPSEAVLEISETISGIARNARMRQEKHVMRMQNQQYEYQQMQHQGQQGEPQYHQQGRQSASRFGVYSTRSVSSDNGQGMPPLQHNPSVPHYPIHEQHQYQQYAQPQQQQHMGQTQHGNQQQYVGQPQHEQYAQQQHDSQQYVQPQLDSQQYVGQQQHDSQQHVSQQQQHGGQMQMGGQQQQQQQQQHGGPTQHGGQQHGGQAPNGGQQQNGLQHHAQQHAGHQLPPPYPSVQGNYQNHPQVHQQPAQFHPSGQGGNFGMHRHSGSSPDLSQQHQIHQQHAPQQPNRAAQHQSMQSAAATQYGTLNGGSYANGKPSAEALQMPSNYHATSSTPPPPQQFPAKTSSGGRTQNTLNTVDDHHGKAGGNQPTIHGSAPLAAHSQVQQQYPPPAPPQTRRVSSEANDSAVVNVPNQPQPPTALPRSDSGVASAARESSDEVSEGGDSEVDEELLEELRKLDEDYERNMQIARKVFDTRMDKIRRSQDEKESLHQKTLEKHERERAEYEKRRIEEEKKQQERLEKLQREWDLKRETLAKQKKLRNGINHTTFSDFGHDSLVTSELTHARTLSSTSSIPSVSPAVLSHKVPHDPGETPEER